MTFKFERTARLLCASDFQAVFDQADLKVSTSELLFLARNNQLGHARLGLVIAKKNIRLAVQRNRVKRIVRDTFRLHQHQLKGIDVIVLARGGLDQSSNSQIHSACNTLWHQLAKRADKRFANRGG